jgi:hypothetical protein
MKEKDRGLVPRFFMGRSSMDLQAREGSMKELTKNPQPLSPENKNAVRITPDGIGTTGDARPMARPSSAAYPRGSP